MGKVASQAVEATLKRVATPDNVMRTRFLHPDTIREFDTLARAAHDADPETLDSINSIRHQTGEAQDFLIPPEPTTPLAGTRL